MNTDDLNIGLATSVNAVDAMNKKFYDRFQYPPSPTMVCSLSDPNFELNMLNQNIGSWNHCALRAGLKIWIAGCGRNQAFVTGLRFPTSRIVASDLSAESLATSEAIANGLGVTNVDFRQQSINDAEYQQDFEYVICTGVIHHNADPAVTLTSLARALKPEGILELMVYNRYHRILTTAFQKAVRILGQGADLQRELQIAERLFANINADSLVARFDRAVQGKTETEFADSFLQPVEYSYTVESLSQLLTRCGLELVTPCLNQFDKARGTFLWNVSFSDSELAAIYEALPDTERWQVANLLMLGESPMLWFYCRHRNSRQRRLTERDLCQQFLEREFVPASTERTLYFKSGTGYQKSARAFDYPGAHPDATCRRIVEAASHGVRRASVILEALGVTGTIQQVNKLRLCLTTSEYPYLLSVG
jgi:2-polyprenyl-3-methyl-5-hydroxy-6-metoxy-1,4-benzoquinol methylase